MSAYELHMQALRPLLQPGNTSLCGVEETKKIPDRLEPELIEFIRQQGLAGHWFKLLTARQEKTPSQQEAFEVFKEQLREATFLYLNQMGTIQLLHRLFSDNKIDYAVYKGAHLREVLYDPPSLRPAVDIDVLIAPENRRKAVELLLQKGFTTELRLRNISVEASFYRGQSSVDLHWNILREQRVKVNVVGSFLSARKKEKEFYCLSPEDSLFIMLVHPVFVKYLTTPHARLTNVVDTYRWIDQQDINWDYLIDLLERTHLKTAAWLTATYCELLTTIPLPGKLTSRMRPSSLKATYLSYWISHNLSTRFLSLKAIPQLFFTLPAQDSFPDTCRLLLSAYPEARRSKKIMTELEEVIEASGVRS